MNISNTTHTYKSKSEETKFSKYILKIYFEVVIQKNLVSFSLNILIYININHSSIVFNYLISRRIEIHCKNVLYRDINKERERNAFALMAMVFLRQSNKFLTYNQSILYVYNTNTNNLRELS